ncbi:hypothetical protein [Pleionea sediminis]|uniref:hypothetical protein n=1 Tax=Pleionea sediminis TaxID=2569479 RepID=UPI001184B9F8|nr:hypothetical protein [Pleionea sediminis]
MQSIKYRVYRFLVGLNLPPILGALLFFTWVELNSGAGSVPSNSSVQMHGHFLAVRALIEVIGFAYIYVGVQSVISTLIMEFLVFKKNKVKTILVRFWYGIRRNKRCSSGALVINDCYRHYCWLYLLTRSLSIVHEGDG